MFRIKNIICTRPRRINNLLYFLFKDYNDNFICILANKMFSAMFMCYIIVAFLPLFHTFTSAVLVFNFVCSMKN